MIMDKVSEAKWEGKVSAKLPNATADQIWPLFTDFFNFHNWFPSLSTCHGVHGANGEPGCIRYCAGFSIPSSSPSDRAASWSKERLVAVDHAERALSYEIVDSNIGFRSYVSTVRIVPEGGGCVIEWRFGVDPVEGWELDDLLRKYDVGLHRMAQRMEASVVGSALE